MNSSKIAALAEGGNEGREEGKREREKKKKEKRGKERKRETLWSFMTITTTKLWAEQSITGLQFVFLKGHVHIHL